MSGTALALGYYRDKEKTGASFVQNPLNQDYPETIYRTGDMAYYGEDGLLYYHARRDFQIKHMGTGLNWARLRPLLRPSAGWDGLSAYSWKRKTRLRPSTKGTRIRK